jgi:hypothetical protein
MEVHRFTLVDSWETCVLIFCFSHARLLRASHSYSGIWQERTLVRSSCATPIQWKLTSLLSSAIIEDINAMCKVGLASTVGKKTVPVTSLSYLGIARLLVLMSRLYLYYRLAYSHLPDLPRT